MTRISWRSHNAGNLGCKPKTAIRCCALNGVKVLRRAVHNYLDQEKGLYPSQKFWLNHTAALKAGVGCVSHSLQLSASKAGSNCSGLKFVKFVVGWVLQFRLRTTQLNKLGINCCWPCWRQMIQKLLEPYTFYYASPHLSPNLKRIRSKLWHFWKQL